jgi:HK97 family phage major capsid protein
MQVENEIKEIVELVKAGEVRHKAAIDEINKRLGDSDINAIRKALGDIESDQRALKKDLVESLRRTQRQMQGARGEYRGVFACEEDARAFGLFVMARAGGSRRATEILAGEMKSVMERAMGGTNSTGEGMVPLEFSNRIQRLVEDYGVFPRNAFEMPMTSDSLTFQRRVGGLTVYKTGRNVAATASDMSLATITLTADEWNALCVYPESLGEDAAAAIGELVAQEIAQAFAQAIDDAAFVGDGTSTYLDVLGITNRLSTINGTNDGGGLVLSSGAADSGWGGIVEADLLKLVGSVPNYRGARNKFYCSNQFAFQVLHKLLLAKGGITAMEFEAVRKPQILGFPIEITPSMPKTTADSQICCLFGDLSLSSTWGNRKNLEVMENRSVKFIERQVAVLGTQRIAIANHTLGDATNPGPVVGLITAVTT